MQNRRKSRVKSKTRHSEKNNTLCTKFRLFNCIWYENNCDLEREYFRYGARVQVWECYSDIVEVGDKCVDTFWNTFDGACLNVLARKLFSSRLKRNGFRLNFENVTNVNDRRTAPVGIWKKNKIYSISINHKKTYGFNLNYFDRLPIHRLPVGSF